MFFYRMKVMYDGSTFNGWQRQTTNQNTIQGILERALEECLEEKIKIAGAGRTDAGVHAKGQVAGFRAYKRMETSVLQDMLNKKLPETIRVYDTQLTDSKFHCRKSAKWKHYCYRIDCREKPHVFGRRYAYHAGETLNIENMMQAAAYLTGTFDFRSFTTDKNLDKNMVRTIYRIAICEEKGMLTLHFYGNGFLYHMIRILSGTLLEVGLGERRPEDMESILQAKDRSRAGVLLPGQGLMLEEVGYTTFCD